MKIKYSLLLVSILVLNLCSAQSYPGLSDDNYNGIHGVVGNPANIADSRVSVDINLFSIQAMVATDYLPLTLDNITTLAKDFTFDDNFTRFPSQSNNVLVNADVLGPSFMLGINEKNSVGIITRARGINNYNNVNGELLESIIDGFPTTGFSFDQNNLDGTTHFWGEIGLSYGRVIYDEDNHFIKGGLTLKYLLGGGVAQGTSENMSGAFDANSNSVNLNGDFSYLVSFDEDDFQVDLTPGYGMDIGFVYEYRPRSTSVAGVSDNLRATNKYKVKAGLALLDFGSIKYKDVELTEYNLSGTVNADEVEEDFITALDDNFNSTTTLGDVTIATPTTLQINIDYNILHKVYASITYNQSILKKNQPYDNNRINLFTLTPRYESGVVGAYLPISYSKLGATTIGLGLRIGPLIIGSGSILSNLIADKAQMMHIYTGLKVPINHK